MVRRQKTNTPLQALVTLNDPTFIEASKVLGEQMCKIPDAPKAIATVYRKLTGLQPSKAELALLLKMQRAQQENFKLHPEKAKGWLDSWLQSSRRRQDFADRLSGGLVSGTLP